VASLEAALAYAESYAPEHLELLVTDPEAAAREVRNAGAVFLGPSTPAVLGDYAAGSNHVLPTGGLAWGAGGLGLETFLKPVQFVRATPAGLAAACKTVEALARIEGLPLHAEAVLARLSQASK
jgi:histidinol dehydrogenase